jgi:hypothetical protein
VRDKATTSTTIPSWSSPAGEQAAATTGSLVPLAAASNPHRATAQHQAREHNSHTREHGEGRNPRTKSTSSADPTGEPQPAHVCQQWVPFAIFRGGAAEGNGGRTCGARRARAPPHTHSHRSRSSMGNPVPGQGRETGARSRGCKGHSPQCGGTQRAHQSFHFRRRFFHKRSPTVKRQPRPETRPAPHSKQCTATCECVS